jgi:hypothetical protein
LRNAENDENILLSFSHVLNESLKQISEIKNKKYKLTFDTTVGTVQPINQNAVTIRDNELFKSLNEKYGDGNYDPNTGIFTPINNEVTQ